MEDSGLSAGGTIWPGLMEGGRFRPPFVRVGVDWQIVGLAPSIAGGRGSGFLLYSRSSRVALVAIVSLEMQRRWPVVLPFEEAVLEVLEAQWIGGALADLYS